MTHKPESPWIDDGWTPEKSKTPEAQAGDANRRQWREQREREAADRGQLRILQNRERLRETVRYIASRAAEVDEKIRDARIAKCDGCSTPTCETATGCSLLWIDHEVDGAVACKHAPLATTWEAERVRVDARRRRMAMAGITDGTALEAISRARVPAEALPRFESLPTAKRDNLLRAPRRAAEGAERFLRDRPWSLLLRGARGTWKTWAAACVVAETDGALWLSMRTVAPAESWNALQPRAFAAPLVVLSDLGTESPSAWHRSQLAQIINQRHDDRLPVIVTTNLQPGQMTGQIGSLEFYGDRAWDRLRGGIDVECVGPSLREVLK